ncbi:hypothetical protein L596_005876 [Steinernema carpocapsae]|uniref:Uncharacterized protein n=1 Tax=Steinernema carpocapsae TaxID=34508 RepID=A0A4V6I8L1_STECR|nr:hypothetical protein L596_005876 [Steinernema carpocapsae]
MFFTRERFTLFAKCKSKPLPTRADFTPSPADRPPTVMTSSSATLPTTTTTRTSLVGRRVRVDKADRIANVRGPAGREEGTEGARLRRPTGDGLRGRRV